MADTDPIGGSRLLASAVRLLAFDGIALPEVTVAGRSFHALVHLDAREHRRRLDIGLTTVLDRQVLAILGTIPSGHALPWDAVDPLDAAVLDTAQDGLVQDSDAGVERNYTPALDVAYVIATEAPITRRIEEISLFAAVAPRIVVGSSFTTEALDVAEHLGVGCIECGRGNDASTRMLVEASRARIKPDPTRWWFQELLYGEVLRRANSGAPTHPGTLAPSA